MSLNTYGFTDNEYMKPKSFDVLVSAEDKIIQVMDGNTLLASLSMSLNNNILSLIGKKNAVVAEVELPNSQQINNAYYDSQSQEIVLEISMSDGTTSTINIDVSDLIMIYEGEHGIEINGNKISLKINDESEKYLYVDENGLYFNVNSLDETYATDDSLKAYATKDELSNLQTEITDSIQKITDELNNKADIDSIPSLVGYATEKWVEEQGYLTEHQDISHLATKEDVNNLSAVVDNKVDWVDITTPENPNRKCIVLKNHDTILGTDTSGKTRSLLMVNKWDVVDLGTTKLPINLNTPKDVRPTVQEEGQTGEEAHKIAYVEDIDELKNIITSGDSAIGDLLNNYALKDHNHDGVYYPNENGVTLNQKVDDLSAVVDNKVDWVDITTEENPNRKCIVLKNHDTILGTDTSGKTRSLLMVNKWDVVDLGTTKLPINLNTPKDVRPTVQEEGQTGEEAHKIAYVEDIDELKNIITSGDSAIGDLLNNYVTKEKHKEDLNKKADEDYVNDELSKKLDNETFNNEINSLKETLETKADISSITDLNDKIDDLQINKQDKLIAGVGIAINDNTINCTLDNEIFIVTDSLPVSGSPNKIYLIPNDSGVSNNSINEYYYINNSWEKIGEYKADVDLSNYVTNEYFNSEVPSIIDNKLVPYATQADVQKECQIQVASGVSSAITASQLYSDEKNTIIKAESQEYVNNRISATTEAIDKNSQNIILLTNRCDHFDELFSDITTEHGDGELLWNVYTKDECNNQFATKESLTNKVGWVDITTPENPNRKCIVLKNHDTILGTDTSDKTRSLLMVNKWDVVDLGTTKLPINLNTPKNVRPTVQEEGQTGEEAHKIAYVEDIDELKTQISALNETIRQLEERLQALEA